MKWDKIYNSKLKYFLVPPFIIYWILLFIRNALYSFNILKSKKLSAKIISIGNITFGGTGKTPATMYLANLLKGKNKKVAILSRGYKRKTKGTQLVTNGKDYKNNWENFGDEPALMATKLKGIPIVVDEDRLRGGQYIINHFNPDIIILDDAFQSRAIKRDLDIVLINSQDSINDYRFAPFGKLREPLFNLKRADLLIFTKTNLKPISNYLNNMAKFTKLPILKSTIDKDCCKKNDKFLKDLNQYRKAIAISGIGDPKSFYKSIELEKIDILNKITFADHYNYNQEDVDRFKKNINDSEAEIIITTEKDMIKISKLDLGDLKIFSFGIIFSLDKKSESKLLEKMKF